MASCRKLRRVRALLWISGAALTPFCVALAQAPVQSQGSREPRTFLATEFSYVPFQGDMDAWQLGSLSLGRRDLRGTFIARANYARRFGTAGTQIEVDAYPRLSQSFYAYLNAGYSGATVFPEWRFGGELFANFPNAWEGSAGFRQLRFSGPDVTLYTGSVGKYVGNYWLSLRPFVRSMDAGTSTSATLTGRRYFADADHFVGARVGFGSSPSDQITPQDIQRTNSFSIGLHGSGGPWESVIASWSAGYDREELSAGQTRRSWPVSVGLMFVF